MAKKKARKPRGFGAFDELARRVVRVPKSEVERVEAERKKRK